MTPVEKEGEPVPVTLEDLLDKILDLLARIVTGDLGATMKDVDAFPALEIREQQ